jgi:triphosphoribosyl-dephospho-CoA synthase
MKAGQAATLACLLEASTPKVGNVHRGADFEDVRFQDFVISAVAIGETLGELQDARIGETIYAAVAAMMNAVKTNTYLGTILLLAPLSKLGTDLVTWPDQVTELLQSLNAHDTELVYQAIQVASPGGLGTADRWDVNSTPPSNLVDAMKSAAHRDSIAAQYAYGFRDVFHTVIPFLKQSKGPDSTIDSAIMVSQLQIMAEIPDSLIARKLGRETAEESARRAAQVVATQSQGADAFYAARADFDFWLRSDGHRRNPGTTADLIAAGLFALLRSDSWIPPFK